MKWFLIVNNLGPNDLALIEQRFYHRVAEFDCWIKWRWNAERQRFYSYTALDSQIFSIVAKAQVAALASQIEGTFDALGQVIDEGVIGNVKEDASSGTL